MNFLFHFHLAHGETGDPLLALGAMLPDLWRMAAREARAKRDVRGGSEEVRAILSGVDHHLDADLWFHKTPVFLQGEAAASRALGETGIQRMRLFGHIAWEMCLDGALVRRRPHLDREVFSALDGRIDLLLRAGIIHHADKPALVESAAFRARMTRILEAIRSFELPGGYATAHGVAMRLVGLRASFGLSPPSDNEWKTLENTLASLSVLADTSTADLLEERRILVSPNG